MALNKRRNLSRRIFVIITALIIILLVISLSSFLLTNHIAKQTERLSNYHLPGFQNILETNRDLYNLLLAERSLCLVEPGSQKQRNYLKAYQDNLLLTEENLKRLKALPLTEQEKLKIPVIEGGWQTWKSLSRIVIDAINEGTVEGQIRARVLSLNFSADALYNRLLRPLNELQEEKYQQIDQIRATIRSRERQIIFMTGAMFAAAVGISIIFFILSVGIFEEIKRRRKAETALAKEKEVLELFVNSSSDIIYFKDLEGNYTRVNPCFSEWLGLRHPDEAIGKNELAYWDADIAHKAIEQDRDILRHGKRIVDMEMRIQQPGTNARRWFLVTKHPLFDENGNQSGTYGIFKDITERKNRHAAQVQAYSRKIQKQQETVEEIETEKRELEHHFRQVQKMEALGTLAGGIAHDFNNILSSILGYVEMAIEDVDPNSALVTNLEAVHISGLRAKDLVNQILTFARQAEQKLQPVQVSLIAKETLKLLRATIPITVSIRQELKCDALVMTDPSQIYQVIMNLCTNAIQSIGDKHGVLTVELEACHLDAPATRRLGGINTGDYLRLEVSDTGNGIDPDCMDKIFEPYFTTKKSGKGTGLGLSVVHGIVSGCGGAIEVRSTLGKGTTFTVFLPVTQRRAEQKIAKPAELLFGNERILIVEDDLLIAALWSQMLSRRGYDVTVFNNSVEALAQLKKAPEQYDLVITDLNMPQMAGDRLAVAVSKIKADLPLILCTGDGRKISADRARAMGVHLAMKPLGGEELALQVRKVLDRT